MNHAIISGLLCMLVASPAFAQLACEWIDQGNRYYGIGNYEKALECYDRAIEVDQNYKLVYVNKGVIYRELGEYDLAIKEYNRALEVDPNCIEAWNELGKTYEAMGDYAKAEECYGHVTDTL